jgi:hypothetical protein
LFNPFSIIAAEVNSSEPFYNEEKDDVLPGVPG